MAAGGDSRAMFVVQRAFRRVRRGYDPEEVDRHLRLVSEWFAASRAGQGARDLEARVEERAEAERLRAEAEQVVVEAREEAVRLLAEAGESAAGEREAARADAEAARR